MSSPSPRIQVSAPITRSVAIAAFLGAAVFAASPVTTARAESPTPPAVQLPQTTPPQAGVEATEAQMETVEQRIASLHTALKITPDQDAKWAGVAQAMRENAAAMQKLVAERAAQDPKAMTAVSDLKSYEAFTQAHADGLKNLMSSFELLYNSMAEPQKKIADQVFENFGRKGVRSHG